MNKEMFGDLTTFRVSDLRVIDVFEAKLEDGKMLPLYGPNGSGKSTIIDALEYVFTGGKLPEDLIRHGKKEALIEAFSSTGVSVKKRIRKTRDGKQVSELVLTQNNAVIPSPQKALKELFGGLQSPNKIAEQSGVNLFRDIARSAGIDTVEIDQEISSRSTELAFTKRDLVNMGDFEAPEPIPEEFKDLPEFNMEEYNKARDSYAEVKTAETNLETLKNRIEEGKRKIVAMGELLAKITMEAEEKEALVAKKEEIEEEYLSYDLALQNKTLLDKRKEYDDWLEKKMKKNKEIDKISNQIKALKADKENKLVSADLGVEGLELTESGGVKLNGHQWENACFSDRIKAALILQMRSMDKSKLNLLFLEHGESLSREKRNELAVECKKNGCHLVMEVFTENLTSGVEDGIVLHPVSEEPVIPEPEKKVPFGKPIPEEITKKAVSKSNPFDDVDLGF